MHRNAARWLECACTAWLIGSGCARPATEHAAKAAPIQETCPIQPAGTGGQAVDRMREAIFRNLGLQPGMRVGDIGTGGGWFTLRVAQAVGRTGMVYGTDIDKNTVASLRSAPSAGENAAPMRFTLVTGPRDTGLDDLPANHLDLVLMIDSLCFDGRTPRAADLAYLSKFLRILKPGGRFVHHMDCTCRTTVPDTEALFIAAGFAPQVGHLPITCDELSTEGCPSAQAQARARFVGIFTKPN